MGKRQEIVGLVGGLLGTDLLLLSLLNLYTRSSDSVDTSFAQSVGLEAVLFINAAILLYILILGISLWLVYQRHAVLERRNCVVIDKPKIVLVEDPKV